MLTVCESVPSNQANVTSGSPISGADPGFHEGGGGGHGPEKGTAVAFQKLTSNKNLGGYLGGGLTPLTLSPWIRHCIGPIGAYI